METPQGGIIVFVVFAKVFYQPPAHLLKDRKALDSDVLLLPANASGVEIKQK